MSRTVRGILYGVAAVLAVSIVGSAASRVMGFNYTALAPLSFLIFVGVGAYVGAGEPVSRAAAVGALLGVVEATVGWAISWAIGPGRPQEGERISFLGLFNTVVFVAALAAALGALGGWLAHRRRRRRAARAS